MINHKELPEETFLFKIAFLDDENLLSNIQKSLISVGWFVELYDITPLYCTMGECYCAYVEYYVKFKVK